MQTATSHVWGAAWPETARSVGKARALQLNSSTTFARCCARFSSAVCWFCKADHSSNSSSIGLRPASPPPQTIVARLRSTVVLSLAFSMSCMSNFYRIRASRPCKMYIASHNASQGYPQPHTALNRPHLVANVVHLHGLTIPNITLPC